MDSRRKGEGQRFSSYGRDFAHKRNPDRNRNRRLKDEQDYDYDHERGKPGKSRLDFSDARLHDYAMKLILSTHNVTLTKAIEDHIFGKLDKLERLDHRAIDARVTLEHDHTRVPERQFSCSIRLSVRGPDLFAEDHRSDLYAAIDFVSKKIEQQIRKRQNKHKARKHKVAARTKRTRQESAL